MCSYFKILTGLSLDFLLSFYCTAWPYKTNTGCLVEQARGRNTRLCFWSHCSGVSVRGSIGSPLEEDLVAPPVSEASSPHSQVLHQAQILDLVTDQHLVKADWNQMGEWKTKTTERTLGSV